MSAFWKAVLKRRKFACCLWSLLAVGCLDACYIFICQFSLFSPLSSLYGLFEVFFSTAPLLCWSLLLTSGVGLAASHALICRVSLPLHLRRWDMLKESLSGPCLAYVLLSGLTDMLHMVLLWQLSGWPSARLSVPCSSEGGVCVASPALLVVVYGAVLGMYSSLSHFVTRGNLMVFPVVQQQRVFVFKAKLKSSIGHGLWSATKAARMCLPASLLIFMVSVPHPLEWSVYLLFQLLLLGGVVGVARRITSDIVAVVFTQPVQFAVTTKYAGEKSLLLQDALRTGNQELLKYLAFMDLHRLALRCPVRRQELFSLTIPGGPSPWDSVYAECMVVMATFCSHFLSDQPSSEPLPAWQAPPPAGSPVYKPITDAMDSPMAPSPQERAWQRAKLWSQSPGIDRRAEGAAVPRPRPRPSDQRVWAEPVKQWAAWLSGRGRGWWGKGLARLRERKLLAYFVKEDSEVKECLPFKDFLLVIWCVEAVSELAVCSYHEDKYGLLQKDLPGLFSRLIQMSKALDGVVKTPIPLSSTKTCQAQDIIHNAKHAVKAAVGLALHKMATVFGGSVRLSEQDVRYLAARK